MTIDDNGHRLRLCRLEKWKFSVILDPYLFNSSRYQSLNFSQHDAMPRTEKAN